MVRRDALEEFRQFSAELAELKELVRLRRARLARKDEKRIRKLVEARQTRPGFIARMLELGELMINVRNEEGVSFKMHLFTWETIYAIKLRIDIMKSIPLEHQALLWRGQEMENEKTVGHYNLEDECEINLVDRRSQP